MRRGLTRRVALSVAGAIALAAVAGCGGDSGATLKEFRADANRVCRDVERQLDRIQRTQPVTAAQAEEQAEAVLDVSEQALSNLRKIEPPDDLEAAWNRYLDDREQAIGFIEEAREAAADSDTEAYAGAKRRLARGQPARRELALQMELGRCSRPSRP